MSDLISREALLEAHQDLVAFGTDTTFAVRNLITNAPAITQGEPVGSIFRICTNRLGEHFLDVAVDKSKVKDGDKLYTAPPQPQAVKDALEKAAKIAESYEPDEKLNEVTYASKEIRALIEKE